MTAVVPKSFQGDDATRFADFLVLQLGRCGHELTDKDAPVIMELTSWLLIRLETHPLENPKRQAQITSSLLFLVIVAAHLSGNFGSVLPGLDKSCKLMDLYEEAVILSACSF